MKRPTSLLRALCAIALSLLAALTLAITPVAAETTDHYSPNEELDTLGVEICKGDECVGFCPGNPYLGHWDLTSFPPLCNPDPQPDGSTCLNTGSCQVKCGGSYFPAVITARDQCQLLSDGGQE